MRIAITIGVVLAVTLIFRGAIRKYPWLLYCVCGVVCVVYFASFVDSDLRLNYAYAQFLKVMQRGAIGFAFLTIVMYIGVLPKTYWARDALGPIRRQLSIAGCMLLVPHIAFYSRSYLLSNVLEGMDNVSISLVFAGVLVVIGLILFMTSLVVVRRMMNPVFWKHIQRASYAFFGLTFIHLLLFLAPSAMAGKSETQTTVAVYLVLGLGYTVLRVVRYALDGRVKCREEASNATR